MTKGSSYDSSLLRLLRRHDRLPLDRIAGVAPLFERVTVGRQPLQHVLVRMRLLIELRIAPDVLDREPSAIRRNLEPLYEMRFWCTEPARSDRSLREADRIYDQRVTVILPDGMSAGGRRPPGQIGMGAAVHEDVPHPAAFRRDDDLVPLRDDVDAAGIWVESE